MSGIDVRQLKYLVVAPSLAALGLNEPAAINLVTGTALAETRAVYLRQLNDGPALGLWQMEPSTHDDCWANFLNFPAQRRFLTVLRGMLSPDLPKAAQLVTNLRYAAAMTRIRFYRVAENLPLADNAAAQSAYHKKYYNSCLGSANADANTGLFQQAIDA